MQGTAEVDDRDLDGQPRALLARVRGEAPGDAGACIPPKLVRGMFGWYYTRIYVHVRPERVFVWDRRRRRAGARAASTRTWRRSAPGTARSRSSRSSRPRAAASPGTSGSRSSAAATRRAVLALGRPRRLPARRPPAGEPDRGARRIVFGAGPRACRWREGRACVTAHRHSPDFTWQENFQVRGDLVRADGGWAAGAPQARRWLRAAERERAGRYRRNLSKSIRFYKTARRELRKAQGRAAQPATAQLSGNGSSPACQGPAG